LPMVCSVLSPVGRNRSGWPPRARPTRLCRRGMWLVSSPSMSGGLECQRAASCGRSCTTTGWSCTTSTPTLSRKRPSSRRFARVFLGIDPHWDLWTHLFSVEFFAATTKAKKVHMAVRAGGCTLQLRPGRAQQYIPASLVSSNKGWQNRWFYLRNDGGMLPPFSQRVVTAAGNNWRWGATRENQEKLQPILQALQKVRDGGLTAAGVVAAIHCRRVLPLAERRLRLAEMKPGVDLEGSRMSSTSLFADDLLKRVASTVGRLDAGALSQPAMRPDRGYVSLVSARSFFCFAPSCL
jgi:hypothetical protein